MQRNHICDEGIATYIHSIQPMAHESVRVKRTPSGYHVEVEHSSKSAEKSTSLLQRFDPAEKGEHEEEDGDGFIIVGACDGTRDISGYNADESSGEEASALIFHLGREPNDRMRKD
jgi:hypothetical protein